MTGQVAIRPVVVPITDADVDRVAEFFSVHLNRRVPTERWRAILRPPWQSGGPNRGFQLTYDGAIVGAYAVVYSDREIGGQPVRIANLAAFCVLPEQRAHALRLMRAVLGQKGLVFTDLSPSGNVPALNERLGFARLDTATRLVVHGLARRRCIVSAKSADFGRTLRGRDAEVYRDHRDAPASRHLLIREGGRYAYLIYRRDRRKRLPLFASPLYVGGDASLLQRNWSVVGAYLLRRGFLATLAERRVLGFTPSGIGRELRRPRTKMFKGAVSADAVDYLYSELTLLEW